jgi:hypothetical protein
MKQATSKNLLYASFQIDFLFNTEDGSDMSLQNFGWISTDYTALYLKSMNSS